MADAFLPMLMYHGLHAGAQESGVFDAVYSVDPDDFALQLDWLAHNNYRTVRLRDLDANPGDRRRVVVTFDDGDISNRSRALPMLVERRMVAEFFVTAGHVGQPGKCSEDDLRELVAAGMGVQSHGWSHRYLADLSEAELESELVRSRDYLQSVTGERVTALALPGGRGGERERRAALRLGYLDLLNSEPGPNRDLKHGEYLQRLTIKRGMPLAEFARLVDWHGARPRLARVRYQALACAKRIVGNERYETMRSRILDR